MVGHNVSFDRAYIKEQYLLKVSLHTALCIILLKSFIKRNSIRSMTSRSSEEQTAGIGFFISNLQLGVIQLKGVSEYSVCQ